MLTASVDHILLKDAHENVFLGLFYRLLLRLQIRIFSASAISESRKSGWQTEMILSALSHVEMPFKFTMPYSVTRYWMFVRVSVTMEPLERVGRIREDTVPSLAVTVEEQQIKLLPPLLR